MRILLYGENWKGSHVDCIAEVLKKKDIPHRIFNFYPMLHKQTGNRFTNKIIRELFYTQNEATINRSLLLGINDFKPDILLISKGVNIFPETLAEIKAKSIKIVNWNPDDFLNPLNSSKHLLSSLGLYDCVFSARKHLFEEYKQAGIKDPFYLEWYYIPGLHKKPDPVPAINPGITFVGTFSKRREKIINAIDTQFPVAIWGAGWTFSKIRLKRNIQLNDIILPQQRFPEIMAASLINLNILTVENRDLTNLKIFEIAASYGLLLTEFNSVSENIMGKACLYYDVSETAQLNERIAGLFETPAQMIDEQRRLGFDRIMNGHNSIDDRVAQMLEHIAKA